MKTGILGGTFNPPHLGHWTAACNAKAALELDTVLFIPTNLPPHKKMPQGSASAAQRCEMVRRMIDGAPWARLDTMELQRGGASYTVDTLRALHARGETELYLIVGTDMLLSFDNAWRAPEQIARLCTLAVCAREEKDSAVIDGKAKQLRRSLGLRVVQVEGEVLPVSSTELRCGGALRRLTPPAVAEFIEQNHLYGF